MKGVLVDLKEVSNCRLWIRVCTLGGNCVNHCTDNMLVTLILVMCTVPFLILYVFGGYDRDKLEREHRFYRNVYNLSIECMLTESPLDRSKILDLKRKWFGRRRAIRYVRKWDPVPPVIAALFVDAVR